MLYEKPTHDSIQKLIRRVQYTTTTGASPGTTTCHLILHSGFVVSESVTFNDRNISNDAFWKKEALTAAEEALLKYEEYRRMHDAYGTLGKGPFDTVFEKGKSGEYSRVVETAKGGYECRPGLVRVLSASGTSFDNYKELEMCLGYGESNKGTVSKGGEVERVRRLLSTHFLHPRLHAIHGKVTPTEYMEIQDNTKYPLGFGITADERRTYDTMFNMEQHWGNTYDLNFAITGPPGCGKTTLGKVLAERNHGEVIDVGDLLRRAESLPHIHSIIGNYDANKGILLSSEQVNAIVDYEIKRIEDLGKNWVLVGAPRKTQQLNHILNKYPETLFICLDVNDSSILSKRLGLRATEEDRKDDNYEIINKRFGEYLFHTAPMMNDFIKRQSRLLSEHRTLLHIIQSEETSFESVVRRVGQFAAYHQNEKDMNL